MRFRDEIVRAINEIINLLIKRQFCIVLDVLNNINLLSIKIRLIFSEDFVAKFVVHFYKRRNEKSVEFVVRKRLQNIIC